MSSASGSATDAGALTALADPTRARIVRLIQDADGGRALVGRVADELRLRQPTISHHMGVLHAEGIVVREREGRKVWYSVNPDESDRIAAVLGTAPQAAEPDFDRVIDDLAERYRGRFSRETVARCIADSADLLRASSGSSLLTSRTAAFAASRLDDLASTATQGTTPNTRPTVLFVCVQNAGRSQLAAGILRQLAGDRVTVRTAGSAPASEIRAAVVTALDEIGVTLGGEFPKPLTDEAVRAADVVVTMGCGDACPVYPGRRYLDWDLDDPSGLPMTGVRTIRDEIDRRVRELLEDI